MPPAPPPALESLIEQQGSARIRVERLRTLRADLEKILTKAQHASAKYTQERYEALKARWIAQDAALAELLEDMVRKIPAWPGIVESRICPLIDALRQAEHELHGDEKPPSDLHNQFDLVYWYTREKQRKERRFSRITALLGAWDSPSDSIEKVLNDNANLIAESRASLEANAEGVGFDILLRLVPRHLAVAPPAISPELTTQIAREYTQLCVCDPARPESLHGEDAGVPSLLERIVGPHACLVEPHEYHDVISCLAQGYVNAREALVAAETQLAQAEKTLETLKATVEDGLRDLNRAVGLPARRPR